MCTKEEIIERLKKTFHYVLNESIDVNKVNLEDKLIDDLGFTSVALIYFAVMIEEEFEISLEDAKLSDFVTVEDVINHIYKKVNK